MRTPTEITQQAYGAFTSGNISALLDLLTDDVEWRYFAKAEWGTPYGGDFKGKQEVARFFGTLAQTTEIQRFEPIEFLEGPQHVTTIGRSTARALPDGKVFDTEWIHIAVIDGSGKIARWFGTEDSAARLDK
jgi:uncharacterized protein